MNLINSLKKTAEINHRTKTRATVLRNEAIDKQHIKPTTMKKQSNRYWIVNLVTHRKSQSKDNRYGSNDYYFHRKDSAKLDENLTT